MCVSDRTLRTKRHELEITDKYTGIRDNELDNFIQEILEESLNMGAKMLQGALQSRGIGIQQRRLRSSIERTDPIGKVLRRLRTLRRKSIKLKDQMHYG